MLIMLISAHFISHILCSFIYTVIQLY